MIMDAREDQTQNMIKGKRTKRQRPPTQLSLAMPEASSSRTTSTDNSGGVALSATSPATVTAATSAEEADQDMANCLILLAHGGHAGKASSEHVTGPCLYQCKTCNRCFSSFQALGGHRASHKKPNNKLPNAEEKQSVTFVNEDNHYYDPTALSLQISAGGRALYNVNSNKNNSTKSKVHECAICGAEFSSGQALGGHMRRHRTFVNASATSASAGKGSFGQSSSEAKKPRNVLKLDLNLPAPEDDLREPKFPFQSKEKVIVFSASSLVDCHY